MNYDLLKARAAGSDYASSVTFLHSIEVLKFSEPAVLAFWYTMLMPLCTAILTISQVDTEQLHTVHAVNFSMTNLFHLTDFKK